MTGLTELMFGVGIIASITGLIVTTAVLLARMEKAGGKGQ